jgi:hypothetical protein
MDNKLKPQSHMKLFKYSMLVAAVCTAFTMQSVKADLFTSSIGTPNDAISPFPGPYATVDVNLTSSTTASITFTSLVQGGNIYLFGGVNAVDLNVNASSFTVGTITGSNAGTGFTPGPLSNSGSGNVDGLGTFNLTIRSFDGFTHSSDTVTFDLTNAGGTWASAADVLAFNSNGFDAAMHVFVTSSPANASNGAIATGFAGEGPQGHVPDSGATAALLGLGLAGLAGLRARFGRK